ncbi:hypothetical protein [Methanoregula sp.]|uniref:hypothetical protein n=1 Tax=Methanoregula sp. TaxID=2052170 RepID=UPI003C71D80C
MGYVRLSAFRLSLPDRQNSTPADNVTAPVTHIINSFRCMLICYQIHDARYRPAK